jgi:uncharacterized LabA/DUF88 family protein
MSDAALFIDLPNFYSHLLKSGIGEPRFLRDYFLYWLDLDLLAAALTDSFSGIWVFYSGERIGPSNERVEGKYLQEYIDRINTLQGVTAQDVNIPGEQREYLTAKCENCGEEQVVEWRSEKGIDASLTVHMFDTMEAWEVAFLLSGDADFVPAVASLRRRGKIVIGAGFPDRSSALVRECFDYTDLSEAFLARDVAAYAIFRKPDGIIWKWFADDLPPLPVYPKRESAELLFEWDLTRTEPPYFGIYLSGDDLSSLDLSSRHQHIQEFRASFPNQELEVGPRGGVEFRIDPLVGPGIERRLRTFLASIEGLQSNNEKELRTFYRLKYRYNDDEGRFIPILRTEE